MFIHGIESEFLETAKYTSENLKEIIKVFLEKYADIDERNRFHLVLNNLERQYLDWAQFSKSKSRTKIIKEALKRVIDNDHEYTNYLSKHED